jgi:hypothetical protein
LRDEGLLVTFEVLDAQKGPPVSDGAETIQNSFDGLARDQLVGRHAGKKQKPDRAFLWDRRRFFSSDADRMSAAPGKICIDFFSQNPPIGIHRSGWQYVIDNLTPLLSPDGIWCDLFVERTFLMLSEQPSFIPYARPWVGFSHNTFDAQHSAFSAAALLNDANFKASLANCKGLFVFGECMQQQWTSALTQIGQAIPVTSLTHPTEFGATAFSASLFDANTNKRLVQIGAHMRDVYAIFRLDLGGATPVSTADGLALWKSALNGPLMQDVYQGVDIVQEIVTQPPANAPIGDAAVVPSAQQNIVSPMGELPDAVESADVQPVNPIICRISKDSALSSYVIGAIDLLKQINATVTILPTLADADYDALLSQNVAFLELFDATTAINTVLECIARNTPVLVNRLPATVELLGSDYPFFFDDESAVLSMLSSASIMAASGYLASMDKQRFTIQHFLSDFQNALLALGPIL